MIQEVYVVRHATPDRAMKIAYNQLPGPPLLPIGLQEAAQTGDWLRDRGIEYVFVSPFERTRATADILLRHLKLPYSYVEGIRESAPGERVDKVRARVAEFLAQIDDSPFRCVALVSHGLPIREVLRHTTNDRIDLRGHTYDYGNNTPAAGVWHGVRGENGWRWELAFRPAATKAATAVGS